MVLFTITIILFSSKVNAQLIATFQGTAPSWPCTSDGTLCCVSISGVPGSNYIPVLPYTCTITNPVGSHTYNSLTDCFTGMVSGYYTIHIQDSAGATGDVYAQVPPSSISALSIQVTVTPANCTTGIGSACVVASGGSGSAITYNWALTAPPHTQYGNGTCSGPLPVGHYTLTIHDTGTPCYTYEDVYIYQSAVNFTGVTHDATCTSPCNGYISVDLTGLTLPATVSWTGPSNGNVTVNSNSYNITGLCSGIYQVTVSSNGCSSTQQFTVGINNADIFIIGCNNPIWNPGFFNGINDVTLPGNLIVSANACLYIQDMIIRLKPGKYIRIEGTGSLTTTNTKYDSGCGAWWSGFEVKCLAPNTNPANRGVLKFSSNCIITHADFAIRNYQPLGTASSIQPGGKIDAADTRFVDNNRDLWLWDYYPANIIDDANAGAQFLNCSFELNSYPAGTSDQLVGQAMVNLRNIADVRFNQCRAENFNANYLKLSYGQIYKGFLVSNYANYIWNGCDLNGNNCENSYVRGYVNGMNCNGDISVQSPNVTNVFLGPVISKNTFSCYKTLSISNTSEANVTDNVFNLFNFPNSSLAPNGYHGLLISYPAALASGPNPAPNAGCHFLFAGNQINYSMTGNNVGNIQHHNGAGIAVFNCGEHNNYVIQNTFNGCGTAGLFDDRNKGSDFIGLNNAQGLHYECNTLVNGYNDFLIRDNYNNEGDDAGVFGKQRQTFVQTGNSSNTSAGNKFNNSVFTYWDDDINNHIPTSSATHRYVYDQSELNAQGISDMSPQFQILIPDLYPNGCGYDYSNWTLTQSNSQLLSAQNAYQESKAVYLALRDGGNTESLKNAVVEATFDQALILYNTLIQNSPNLSDEVMVEAIQKEDELPASLLTIVLCANPSAAKSASVERALSARSNPLTAYQLGLIEQGWNVTSAKEMLEEEMSEQRIMMEQARFQLLENLRTSPDESNALQKALATYQEDEFLSDRLSKADLMMRHGQFLAGKTLLLTAFQHFKLDDDEQDGIIAYADLLTVENAILTRTDHTLTSSEISYLQGVYDTDPCGYGLRAYHLLEVYEDYPPPAVECSDIAGAIADLRHAFVSPTEEMKAALVEVYPNPATGDLVVIEFEKLVHVACRLEVYSAEGKLLVKETIPDGQTQVVLPTSTLTSGANILNVFGKQGELLQSIPFIKQ